MYNEEYDENPFLIKEQDYDNVREYITKYINTCEKTGYEFMFSDVEDYLNSIGINTIRKTGSSHPIQLNKKHEDYEE